MVLQTINLTERNPVLKQKVERRQFLFRALSYKNISQEEFDAEMPALDKYIKENLIKVLLQCKDVLKDEVVQLKQSIPSDGDMKRAIARILITILKEVLIPSEVKGVLRQGYKIMRSET